MLWLNRGAINNKGIKMDFYIGSFSKAMKTVSKEVYLRCFDINDSDLEQIIKSSCNSERLIISFSSIYFLRKLDFRVTTKYKIKFLSFECCGGDNTPERVTIWKENYAFFKNIVRAIAQCGLKNSLEEVDIHINHTLNKYEVQEMFNELEMSHISVVRKGGEPIE